MSGKKVLRRRLWYLGRGNTKKLKLYGYTLIIVILLTFFIYYIESFALPNITEASQHEAEILVSSKITDEIRRHIDEKAKYEDYVTIAKDRNGRIVSVTTDVIKLNRLVTEIKSAVAGKLSLMTNESVEIPYSAIFTKNATLSDGKGFNVRMKPAQQVEAEYISDITPSGDDGARHRIYIQVKLEVNLSLSFLIKRNIKVVSTVPLTEMLFEHNLAPAFFEQINAAARI